MDSTSITATGVVTSLQTAPDQNNQNRTLVTFLLETRYYENKQTQIVNIPVKGSLNTKAIQYLDGANVLINGDFINGRNNAPVVQLKVYNGLIYAGTIGVKKENNNQQGNTRQAEPSGVNNGLPAATNQNYVVEDLPF